VTHRESAGCQFLLYLPGQPEKTEKIRDRGAFFADPLCEVFLRELKLVLEALVCFGCF